MYKKVMFILLTMLFMSGSCDLKAPAVSQTNKLINTTNLTTNTLPANTLVRRSISTPIDTKTISLVDTYKDAIKFNDLQFTIGIPHLFYVKVKSIKISTTKNALQSANITSLSEAKNITDQAKLDRLIKSLTFTFKAKKIHKNNKNNKKFIITGDYKNLKKIYKGLRNDKDNPNLKPKLNINETDIEFNQGFEFSANLGSNFLGNYTDSNGDMNFVGIYFEENNKPAMKDFLGDILGINGIEKFKKYLP